MSEKNSKVEIINPLGNKPNTAKNQKHPLKVKNLKIQEHHFLRIPVILDVIFCFVQNCLFRGGFWFWRQNQCLY